MTKNLFEIIHRLDNHYGRKKWERWRKPIDELIRTILSQNTTDTNSMQTYANLKNHYQSWEDLLAADEQEIIKLIRSGGLAKGKTKKIKRSLHEIRKREGKLSLEFLDKFPLQKAKNYLESLYGVGPKTAACVLIFSFNKPILPADTHVHRVSNRLGIINEKTPAKSQQRLNQIVPDEDKYSFHLNLIEHGRKICKASTPKCNQCFLSALCDYYAEL
ncbi:MAG: endonuclease III [Asgard group archaeon]|nr:endonuclease III [Asgard group archaeon]